MKDFHQIAHRYNLSLPVLGSISEQSVAGSISTATHGCGYHYGCMSTYVESLTLILADSSQVTVSDSEGRELFRATLCGLGLTGIITRVKFKCEESFHLEEIAYSIPFDTFADNYDAIGRSAQHVRMYWYPQVDRVKVELLNRTIKPTDRVTWRTIISEQLMWLFQWYLQPAILLIAMYFPGLTDCYMKACYDFLNKPSISIEASKETSLETLEALIQLETIKRRPKHRVNSSIKIFNFDCGPPHHTYEGAIPYGLTSDALKEFRLFLRSETRNPNGRLKLHFPMEIRPVAADQIWLSPCCGQTVSYLGIVQFKAFGIELNEEYQELFREFEKILRKYQLRSHWAKRHSQTFGDLRRSYNQESNNFDQFLELRSRVDPDFRFLNDYISRHFDVQRA